MVYTWMNSGQHHPSPAMNKWLSSVGENTRPHYLWHFETFIKWVRVNGDIFSKMSPDDMVEYILDGTPRQINDFLDLKKAYLQSMNGTSSYKSTGNKVIQSFFIHNRAPLPRDATLNISADRPPTDGELKPEEIRDLALASNRTYRAVILCMFSAGMGQEEFFYWSNNGLKDLHEQRDEGLVKINNVGRKLAKNEHTYITFLGGDALFALREYLEKTRPHIVDRLQMKNPRFKDSGAIFLNQRGEPLSKNAFGLYWRRILRNLGIIEPKTGRNVTTRYGKGAHEMRDTFRTLWRKSAVPVEYAEYFMGHIKAFDQYGYDKTYKDEKDLMKKYLTALPYLNILTSARPFGLVDQEEYENSRILELEEEVSEMKKQQEELMKLLYENLPRK